MTRILARLTLALALVLGAAGIAVGAVGISDAHHAHAAAAADRTAAASALAQARAAQKQAASAQQSATNALDSIATVTGGQTTALCNTTALTAWNTRNLAAAEQAEADGNTATYVQYVDDVYMIDLICGTNFASQLPNGA